METDAPGWTDVVEIVLQYDTSASSYVFTGYNSAAEELFRRPAWGVGPYGAGRGDRHHGPLISAGRLDSTVEGEVGRWPRRLRR